MSVITDGPEKRKAGEPLEEERKRAKLDSGEEDSTEAKVVTPKPKEADPFIEFDMKDFVFYCSICNTDITHSCRIICTECSHYYLCLKCMYEGKYTLDHRPNHKYRVAPNLSQSRLFTQKWTAEEELRFIKGFKCLGYGNWSDVADYISTKSEAECYFHFWDVYNESHDFPYPESKSELMIDTIPVVPTEKDIKSASQLKLPGSDITGYYPLRGDFDVEFDNDAEVVIKDMEFHKNDPQEEIDLKLKILHIYNTKLDERQKRKEFIKERGLIDLKKLQQNDKKLAKDERDLYIKMRPLARFQTPQEHELFISGLIEEMRIREKIRELQYYRENGIRTFAEAEQFNKEVPRKDSSKKTLVGRSDKTAHDELMKEKLDITSCPDVELLSEKEVELCSTLRIMPRHYLNIKNTLIREACRAGFLRSNLPNQLVQVEAEKSGRIYDFFVTCGWIKKE